MSSNFNAITAAKAHFPQPWKVLEGLMGVSAETLRTWRVGITRWPADKRILATETGFAVDWAAYDLEFNANKSPGGESPKSPEGPQIAPVSAPSAQEPPPLIPAPQEPPAAPKLAQEPPKAAPPAALPPIEVTPKEANDWFGAMFK